MTVKNNKEIRRFIMLHFTVIRTNKNTLSNTLLTTTSKQLRPHFNMGYSTDNILPVESTPSGQSNLFSVEYPCIPHHIRELHGINGAAYFYKF